MPTSKSRHVAIIGAGIVGVSTAIWLQRAGHRVTLIDREGPAAGTSYGNGGVLAACSVVPVTVPGLIGKAPGMLLDPRSPLFLRWSYLPRLLPFLVRYLANTTEPKVRHAARALTEILYDTIDQHQALSAGTGAEKYVKPSDYLFLYKDRATYEADAFGWGIRKDMGFEWDVWSGDEFDAYDPTFQGKFGCVVRLGNHGHISDPGAYVKALATHVEHQGGAFRKAEVGDVRTEAGKVTGLVTSSGIIDCDDMVLAAGVWSGPLARRLGVKIPLESERGYHIELVNPSVMPKAPGMVAAGKFVVTPMEGRLRCAGIVEFGGLDAPPSRAPFELLKEHIHAAIPGIRYDRIDEWMGHRPAPSDSIPAIGPVSGTKGAWVGYGHHHIGLTGGPKTGRLIAAMINGDKANIDLAPYSPSRFN
jgi:D-amino-acid dehydrogenase